MKRRRRKWNAAESARGQPISTARTSERLVHWTRQAPLTALALAFLAGYLTRAGAKFENRSMLPLQPRSRPTFGQLAKAHTFRFLTVIATWALIFAAFIYHPEWIKAWLRFITAFIETIADELPEPWASRVEVALRELGGIIWIQIASAIVLLRVLLWVPFHLWRLWREREITTIRH